MVSAPDPAAFRSTLFPPMLLRPAVSASLHLRWEVVPAACIESRMQHVKAPGFSKEISSLAAAPRRHSSNRMFDKRPFRWLGLRKQGIGPLRSTVAQVSSFLFSLFETHGLLPQMVKGYTFCIALVLSRTGKSEVFQDRIIPDMISYCTCYMELERPWPMPGSPTRVGSTSGGFSKTTHM